MPRAHVIKITGPVILDWGNGMRLQISPAEAAGVAKTPRAKAQAKGQPGRKPSPATQMLVHAMQADHEAGREGSRAQYLQALREAGHKGSDTSANQILVREAKRVFGHTLRAPTKASKANRAGKARSRGRKAVKRGGGRKPSPATQALIDAMQADHQAGRVGSRVHYEQVLRGAGYEGSEAAASQILVREAKRAFGHALGASKAGKANGRKQGKRGRGGSKATLVLREKIAVDYADGVLRDDATHYVRWLVSQPGLEIGLKGARPMVYRELRKARA